MKTYLARIGRLYSSFGFVLHCPIWSPPVLEVVGHDTLTSVCVISKLHFPFLLLYAFCHHKLWFNLVADSLPADLVPDTKEYCCMCLRSVT